MSCTHTRINRRQPTRINHRPPFVVTHGGDDVGLAVGEAAEEGDVERGAVRLRDLGALVAQH
jgi:hypothetical protein